MSVVNLVGVNLKGPNPAPFLSPVLFEITFECIRPLADDLEWKVTYVGSSESKKHDQTLASILVGPVQVGVNKFILETDVPDSDKIPQSDAIGVTLILLSGYYREREFVRVGYYVNNDYDPICNINPDDRPKKPDFSKILRDIMIASPRVTRFPIDWEAETGSQAIPFFGSDEVQVVERVYDYDVPTEQTTVTTPQRNDGKDFTTILSKGLTLMIFQQLDIYELGTLRRVSQGWKAIIDSGVNWKSLDLSEVEWNESEQRKLLDFAISQTSPELEEVNASHCPVLNDTLLEKWLMRATSVKYLDLSFCPGITSESLSIIAEHCKELAELRLICFSNNPSQITFEDPIIRKFSQKFSATLQAIHITGISDEQLLAIGEVLGTKLQATSFPLSSRITDRGIIEFVNRCQQLEYLGVELCELQDSTIKTLRTKVKTLRAWHAPEDFLVDISGADNEQVKVIIKLKEWTDPLAEQYVEKVMRLLPKKSERVGSHIVFNGPIEEALREYQSAGFDVQRDESDGEELGEEDEYLCEICEGDEEEDMLFCVSCDKAFHARCLEIEVPKQKENWTCDDCRPSNNDGEEPPTKKQKVVEGTSEQAAIEQMTD